MSWELKALGQYFKILRSTGTCPVLSYKPMSAGRNIGFVINFVYQHFERCGLEGRIFWKSLIVNNPYLLSARPPLPPRIRLGSVYSTKPRLQLRLVGPSKQLKQIIQTELTLLEVNENPKWPEADQLAIYSGLPWNKSIWWSERNSNKGRLRVRRALTFNPETSHFISRKPIISSYRILVCRQTLSFVLSS